MGSGSKGLGVMGSRGFGKFYRAPRVRTGLVVCRVEGLLQYEYGFYGGYGFRVHRFLGTAPPDVQDSGVRDRVSW